MKPFNLKKALAGEPVVTRNGLRVSEIHLFETYRNNHPVVAVVENELTRFNLDGKYWLRDTSDSTNDLFMK
jgi:hypothetical protein